MYLIIGVIILFFVNYIHLVYTSQFGIHKPTNNSKTLYFNELNYKEATQIVYGSSAFSMVFDSCVKFDNKEHFSILFGDKIIFSTIGNSLDDISKITNTTYKAAFYSLMFVRDLLHSGKINKMTSSQIDQLNGIILKVIAQSRKVPLMDPLILNPHAVSERIEVILLYSAYIKEKYRDEFILKKLQRHANQLVRLLKNDNFFRYNSNHGLMQLRALLIFYIIRGEENSIKDVITKIKEVYPIFVGKDGSILESATGYQFFMYDQFKIIDHILIISGFTDDFLNKQVKIQQNYFSSIITKDGFLQGVGDAYSKYIVNSKYPMVEKNTIFNYANGIAGINSSSEDGDNLSVLFVSLDNKPSSHKLPEDLSLYVYYNEPFFANTGLYSYEYNDKGRRFITSNTSQNGVHFSDNQVDASDIEIDRTSSNQKIIFKGTAFSDEFIPIRRSVKIDLSDSKIIIQDSSQSDIESRFIIHPDITLNVIDDFNIEMIGNKEKMTFKATSPINIRETWISDYYMNRVDSQMLVMSSRNNIIEIQNSRSFKMEIDNVIDKSDEIKERTYLIDKLRKKYPLYLTDIRKLNQFYIMFFLVVSFTLLFLMFLPKKIFVIISCLILSILLFELLSTGSIIVVMMEYLYFVLNGFRNKLKVSIFK